jgi:hypothetical protein
MDMFSLSPGHANGIFYLLVGGPIALGWGLRKLSEKRLIQNTPLSKIRSAAMGLVELQGMARMHTPQKSPLSKMDACWWNCRVEEYRSEGKDSHWQTLKQVGSTDMFYLEDTTGRVLVNPFNAELHVLNNIFELNAATRTQIAPVLNVWGLDDTNWFGGERRMRIIEQLIPDYAPLFVMGELVSIGNDPQDRRAKFMARLRAIKADPAKMAEADLNHDGAVDVQEWDAFEAKQEEEFAKEEMTKEAQRPNADKMMVKAPSHGPFVVSTQEEQSLIGAFNWLAPLGIFGGIALCGLGVWWALSIHWHPLLMIGLLAVGFVLSYFRKTLNFRFERS